MSASREGGSEGGARDDGDGERCVSRKREVSELVFGLTIQLGVGMGMSKSKYGLRQERWGMDRDWGYGHRHRYCVGHETCDHIC